MTKKKSKGQLGNLLRQQAEKVAGQSAALEPETASVAETKFLLHELRVHQIELEMQNEELRRAQLLLDAERERYFDLYDLAPSGYVTLSKKSLILEANRTFATLLGADRITLSTQPLNLYILRDDQDIFYYFFNRLLKTDEPQRCDLRLQRKDGTDFWAQFDGTKARNSEDQELFRIVVSDISERKQTEEALRQEQLFSKSIIDSLPGIFYLYTYPEHRLVRWNKQHETLLGFEAAEMQGRHTLDWHAPEAKDAVLKAIETVMRTGQGSMEDSLLKKDGSLVPFFLTGIRFESQGQAYLLGVGTDITERIQAQKRINRMERLTSLGTLAAGVAHEINQPLQALKVTSDGMLYWLDKDKTIEPEKLKENCNRISRSADRIDKIIKRMRDFVNRSQTELLRAVNLNEALENVVELLHERLKSHDITLLEDLSADPPVLWGNSARVEEVFINLAVNAMQAIDSADSKGLKRREIKISTACQKEKVILEIFNSGSAISLDAAEKIFDPFFTTKINNENMGLGLSIVHSIVSDHGGHISVVNHDDGVSFRIVFPRYKG